MKHNPYLNSNLSFIDMLFLLLLHVFALFILSFILINPPTQKKVDETAQFLITMTWDDNSVDDIDLWLLQPDLNTISYKTKESSYVALERDDLGISNDFVTIDGKKVPIKLNREVIRIRQKVPGTYVVNIQLFQRKPNPDTGNTIGTDPIPVKVEIQRINPSYSLVASREDVLVMDKQEITMFKFVVEDNGSVSNIETTDTPFINRTNNAQAQQIVEESVDGI